MNLLVIVGMIGKYQEEMIDNVYSQLNEFVDDLFVLNFYKSNKLSKKYKTIDFNASFDEYWNFNNYYDCASSFVKKNNVKNCFLFNPFIYKGFKKGNSNIVKKCFSKIDDKIEVPFYTFGQTNVVLSRYIFVKAIYENVENVIQLMVDLQEVSYKEIVKPIGKAREYFITKHNEIKYIPFYEYALFKSSNKNKTAKKVYDFCFCCLCVQKERQEIGEKIKRLENINDKWFVRVFDKSGSALKQDEYYDLLQQSKTTLIIPSYDKSMFCMMRFFEAMFRDCIPLISSDCNLNDVKETFEDIYEFIIKNDLIIDVGNEIRIKEKIQKIDANDMTKQFYELSSIKKILNKSKLKNLYRKLVENYV